MTMNYNRILPTVDVAVMQQSHATVVGGAIQLGRDLVHSGLGAISEMI